jgi:hypothetical protein
LHFSWFNHLKSNGLRVQVMKFLIMQCFPICCYLVPVRLKYLPQHPILEHPHSSLAVRDEVPQP